MHPSANRRGSILLIALTALAFGFFAAGQLRAGLINPSNRLERNEALVRSVQDLEKENAADRQNLTALRQEIADIEKGEAQRSTAAGQLQREVDDLRAHAGLKPLRGPGVTVQIGNGPPRPSSGGSVDYLVTFQDVQDVAFLLFAGGAEGVAVNGRRLSPLSFYQGQAGTVVIDQGPPVLAPFKIQAVGDRNQMERLLGESSSLGDLRLRRDRYGLSLGWSAEGEISLPAYDSSLQVRYAHPG
ncbi:MAG: DUF881 domain-containing protein [Candidatus Dormibacteraeota bacterium]|uniref:DUF881 domain-containing protein n=1 Tax=Candidatus Dormiibacter inghamiae TaxID=3127013 RepID=A0A934KLD8_9BACT|nr:DUF881 domain-containing protein [Candidatus Dormibacteraeota bacterium]MBJ7606397.1 DUF881 domain-containing protein [Candidatus Dormibacteraeota bacterium]